LFRWRGLARQGSVTSVGADEHVVPVSQYAQLEKQVRELQRMLGKKTMENEILREACEVAQAKKLISRSPLPPPDDTR
jgi:transposase